MLLSRYGESDRPIETLHLTPIDAYLVATEAEAATRRAAGDKRPHLRVFMGRFVCGMLNALTEGMLNQSDEIAHGPAGRRRDAEPTAR